MTIEEKNYRTLVDNAEKAYSEKRYLEAFLIQSCVFESVVKDYAFLFLKHVFESHEDLKQKSKNFELARLTDELFIAGKINNQLYKNLNIYRKKRNNVIHKILKFEDKKIFERELKETYELGRDMKGFFIDEMVNKKIGQTMSELSSKLERSLKEIMPEITIASKKEIKSIFKRLNKDFKKTSLKNKIK